MAYAFNFVAKFPMNPRAGHADECPMAQVDALCKFRCTVSTSLVWRQALKATNCIIRIFIVRYLPPTLGGRRLLPGFAWSR